MSSLRGREREVAAAAIVGSVALVASVAIQAVVPRPDAFQFQPALTGPQTLHETVAPGLTLLGLATHAALLHLLRPRDVGRGRRWGRRIALVGLVGAFIGYAGLFWYDTAIGSFSTIAAGLFALIALIATGLTGVGVGVLGVALLRRDAVVERGAGTLLMLTPVAGVAGAWLDPVGWSIPTVVYAAGIATLGYDAWRTAQDSSSLAQPASAK